MVRTVNCKDFDEIVVLDGMRNMGIGERCETDHGGTVAWLRPSKGLPWKYGVEE